MLSWRVRSTLGNKLRKTVCERVPLFEVGVEHPAGETLATDSDSFQNAVTLELVEDQVRVDLTCKMLTIDLYCLIKSRP